MCPIRHGTAIAWLFSESGLTLTLYDNLETIIWGQSVTSTRTAPHVTVQQRVVVIWMYQVQVLWQADTI